jgi:hypothetical protein
MCRTVGAERTQVLSGPTVLAGGAGFEPARRSRLPGFEPGAINHSANPRPPNHEAKQCVGRRKLIAEWMGGSPLDSADCDCLPHAPANLSPDRDPYYGYAAYGGSVRSDSPHHRPSAHSGGSFLGPLGERPISSAYAVLGLCLLFHNVLTSSTLPVILDSSKQQVATCLPPVALASVPTRGVRFFTSVIRWALFVNERLTKLTVSPPTRG